MRKYILIIITILAATLFTACYSQVQTSGSATDKPVATDIAEITTEPQAKNNINSVESPVPQEDTVPATEAPSKKPKPTMDPDTWDYVIDRDSNMHYIENQKTPKVMPYEIHVNKQMNCITIYKANKKGEYTKPVKAMVCSAGRKTPLGTFTTAQNIIGKL